MTAAVKPYLQSLENLLIPLLDTETIQIADKASHILSLIPSVSEEQVHQGSLRSNINSGFQLQINW